METYEIKLSGYRGAGQVALVDASMYEELNKHTWHAQRDVDGRLYAACAIWSEELGKYKLCYMQRLILGAGPGERVLFINGNGLDCRIDNLTNKAQRAIKLDADAESIGKLWRPKRKLVAV